jgi:glycosyltransferase involved in cell wall biosynthesis
MTRKPRILLIPNVAWWIIGEMGREIIARFGDKYDFYFVPEAVFERRPELLEAFIPAVDAIHCLNESSIELFRDLNPKELPPIATWIHHVTTWSPQHQLATERSSALIVCTEGWKQYLRARVDGRVPVTVVPHGVDLRCFHRKKVRPAKFGIPPDRFVVGFIGNKGSDADRGRKGTDVLFEVIRRTAAQLPNLHVVLGGPGWAAELESLRALGISAGATGYIPKSDLPALYSSLDVYLLTSRIEGGPCTVFEAMACQTAVVSTRVGAVPELIVDGENGYSAEVDDVQSLVASITTLGASVERRREIGRNALDTVSKLPWGTALSPLGPVYESLIHSGVRNAAPEVGPAWMGHPEKILRASSAADALASVLNRIKHGSITPFRGIQLLMGMLDKKSVADVIRGFAMWRGWTYKSSLSAASHLHSYRHTAEALPVIEPSESQDAWRPTSSKDTRV